MKTNTKIALGIIAGITAGAAATYAFSRTREGRRALAAAQQTISELRVPEPGFIAQISMTPEEFAEIDQIVCECDAAVGINSEDPVTAVRDCVVATLYPQFPWPPISGDHATVHQLFNEVTLLARRAIVTGTCPTQGPA